MTLSNLGPSWPPGESGMARLIRGHDWRATPLGPLEGWPERLRMAVELMLADPRPTLLTVGLARTFLFNDAAAGLYGARAPGLLGRPLLQAFPSCPEVANLHDRAFAGEPGEIRAMPLPAVEGGKVFDATLLPVGDGAGGVLAVLVTSIEAGASEINAFLVRFSDAARPLTDPQAVARAACRLVAERLGVERAYWAEVDWTTREYVVGASVHLPGIFVIEGRFPVDGWEPFSSMHRAGQPVVVDDTQADPRIPAELKAGYARIDVGADLAVSVVAGGRVRCTFVANQRQPRHWTGAEVALMRGVAERCWAEVERARVEAALRESEERYRTLFETMDEGFVVNELIRDEKGRAVDLRYLELNPAVERLVGWNAKDTVGRRMSEMISAEETRAWVEDFEAILASGASKESEHYHPTLGMWFRANATPVGPDRVALVYQNTTAQKQAEQALREREARQAFLLRLSDALRAEHDMDAVANRAIRMLADHMGLDRCYITFYRPDEDEAVLPYQIGNDTVPPLPARVRLSDFPEAYEQVRHGTFVVDDELERRGLSDAERANSQALGMRAMLASTVRRGKGNPLASLMAVSSRPRRWTPGEVALIEQAAERTWAAMEQARAETALKDSEARLAAAFESVPVGVAVIDTAGAAVIANAGYRRFLPTAIIPSRDPARVGRWQAGDAEGRPLDPQDWPSARALRGERVVPGQEMIYTDEDGREVWTSVSSVPIRNGAGAVTGAATVITDIDTAKRSADALRESEERLRSFGEASSDVLWIRDAGTLQWTYLSPAFESIYGLSREEALRGDTMRNWLDLVVPEDRERAQAEIEKARAGERVTFEYRITRPSDGELRLLRNTDFPIRNESGRVTRIGGVGHDATAERAAAERLQVLVHELQHRTRNLMGVVQSVTNRTLAGSTSLEDFGGRIRDRLGALARVNGLLSRLNKGDRIGFDELIRTELEGHGVIGGQNNGPQVSLRGPRGLRLRSSQVQTLALGLHELATNALKYGALSRPEGRLDISWRLVPGPEGTGRLRVEWRESGVTVARPDGAGAGAAVDGGPPRRRGYGRELIERALPYQLQAETRYELTPGGVRCTITLPLSSTSGAGGSDMEDEDA